VLAKSFARIHFQNLANFGVLPLRFVDPEDWERIDREDLLSIPDVRNALAAGHKVTVMNQSKNETYDTEHAMTPREVETMLAGGLINLICKPH
jgi:aconitate hydratase